MPTELSQITVAKESDLLLVHSSAMQIARLAGMGVAEQIAYAGMITRDCDPANGPNKVSFSIDKQDDNLSFILATISNPFKIIKKEIPQRQASHLLTTTYPTWLKTNEQLQQRLLDMEQFSFALSHELKTSLTKLQLAISLLEKEELVEPINNFVQIIHRSAASLENTLLGLNQILELGHDSPDVIRKISLSNIFDKVYEEFSEMLARSHATLTIDFDSLEEFYYIEIYLRTIFSNLFSNAIKYAEPSRPLQISMAAHRQGDTIILVVIDNGQGIDMETHGPRLFLPFTRFSSKTEGSGIGLYLVKNMVERNDGHIEVESTRGRGTTFRFYLKEYQSPNSSQQSRLVDDRQNFQSS